MRGRIPNQYLEQVAEEANYFFRIAGVDTHIQAKVYHGSYKLKRAFWREDDAIIVLADTADIAVDYVENTMFEKGFAEILKKKDENGETFLTNIETLKNHLSKLTKWEILL